MGLQTDSRKERMHIGIFAIGGVSCSADSLMLAESFVLRIIIICKYHAQRKSAKRIALH